MKHLIDIFEISKSSKAESYTILEVKEIFPIYSNPKIRITKDNMQKYISLNKIYYASIYNDTPNTNKDIYALILTYNHTDKEYNVGVSFMDEFSFNINHNPDFYEFTNLTYRLKMNSDYWIPVYCQYNYERFHTYQTNLISMFDNETEAKKELLNYNIQKYKFMLSNEKATIILLNNKDTYQREFNKLFEEKSKVIRIQVENELKEKKENANQNISKLSDRITYTQELINKLN